MNSNNLFDRSFSKFLSFVLAFSLLLLSANGIGVKGVDISDKDSTNLLINGSFEDGLKGWEKADNNSSEIITTDVKDGTKAIKFSGSAQYAYFKQKINVETNGTYLITFWAKRSKADDGKSSHYLYVMDSKGTITSRNIKPVQNTDGWQEFTAAFCSTESEVSISFCVFSTSFEMFLDNVSVRRHYEINENILSNGDFESGNTDGWTKEWTIKSSITDDAYEGKNALELSGSSWHKFCNTVNVESGKYYILTLYSKWKTGKGYKSVYMNIGSKMNSSVLIMDKKVDGYYKYVGAFKAEDKTSKFGIGIEMSPDDVTLYDSITINEFSDVDNTVQDTNIITNGSFEDGLKGWEKADNNSSEIITSDVHDGKKAVKFSGTAQYSSLKQKINVDANCIYLITFWAKRSEADDGKSSHYLYVSDSKGTITSRNIKPVQKTDGWQEFTVAFSSTESVVSVSFSVFSTSFTMLLDNVSVRRHYEINENILSNGDFENGDTKGWTKEWTINSSITNDAYEGKNALELSGSSWHKFCNTVNVESGKYYILTLYSKWKTGKGYKAVYMNMGSKMNASVLMMDKKVDGYYKYVGAFKAEDKTSKFGIGIEMSPSDVTLYDSITIREFSDVDITVPETGIIKNGSFENDLNGWEKAANNSSEIYTKDTQDGKKSVLFSGSAKYSYLRQSIDVEPDSTYLITFWVKRLEDGTGKESHFLYVSDSKRNIVSQNFKPGPVSNGWQEITSAFTTGDSKVTISFQVWDEGFKVLIDNVKVLKNYDTNKNIISNGDFETGNLDGWSKESDIRTNIIEDSYKGKYAVEFAGAQWNKLCNTVNVEKDKYYIVSLYAKWHSGTAYRYVYLNLNSKNNLVKFVMNKVSDDYYHYVGAFKADDYTAKIGLGVDTSSGEVVQYDNITVREFSNEDGPNYDDLIIYNGSFENDLKGWQVDEKNTSEISTDASDGKKSLKLSGSKYSKVSQNIEVEPNAIYVLSFSTKRLSTDTSNKTLHGVTVEKGKTTIISHTIMPAEASNGWQKMAFAFCPGDSKYVSVNFNIDNESLSLLIDNVQVIKHYEVNSNLITNGTFESGKTDGWYDWYKPYKTIVEDPYEGRYAMSIKCNIWQQAYQKIDVEPGKIYVVSFYAKNMDTGHNYVYMNRTLSGDNNKNYCTQLLIENSSKQYVRYVSAFVANSDKAYISLSQGSVAQSEVRYDNITVREFSDEDKIEVNENGLVLNGGFEKGDLTSWDKENSPTADVTEIDKQSGDKALSFSGVEGSSVNQKIQLKPNTEYRLSVFAKRRIEDTMYYNYHYLILGDNNKEIARVKIFPDNALEWEEFQVHFNSGDVENSKLSLVSGDSGLLLYIDSISLFEEEKIKLTNDGTLNNGNFETGTTEGWKSDNIISTVTNEASEKKHALILSGKTNSSLSQTFKVNPKKTYDVCVYAKRVDKEVYTENSFRIDILNSNGTVSSFNLNPTSTYPEFELFSKTFESGDITDYTVKIIPNTDDKKLIIDDISISEYVAPQKPSLVLSSLFANVQRAKEESYNLINECSFENTTDKAQWNTDTFINPDYLTVQKTDDAYSGNKALYFDGSNLDKKVMSVFWVDVEPNTFYMFSSWVKCENLSNDNLGEASFGVVDPDNKTFLVHKESGKKFSTTALQMRSTAWDGSWHLRSVTFNTGEKSKIGIGVYGSKSKLWLDDMNLCKVENAVSYSNPLLREFVKVKPDAQHYGCVEKDNLVNNFNLENSNTKFWEDGLGFENGFISFEKSNFEYGNSLKYQESSHAVGVHYIKWIELEPNTYYTFSANMKVLKSGEGYFSLMDGKLKMQPIIQLFFDKEAYGEDWTSTGCEFNSGSFNKIGIAVVDKGGCALLDNIRIFKSDKGIDITDKFIHVNKDVLKDDLNNIEKTGVHDISVALVLGLFGISVGYISFHSGRKIYLKRKYKKDI